MADLETNNLWQIFHAYGLNNWIQNNLHRVREILTNILLKPIYTNFQTRYNISLSSPQTVGLTPSGFYINFTS